MGDLSVEKVPVPEEVVQDAMKFRIHVAETLARLDESTKHTNKQMSFIAGSIDDMSARLTKAEIVIATHPTNCPLNGKVAEITQLTNIHLAEKKARDNQQNKWMDKLIIPLLKLIGTIILILAAMHAEELLNKGKKQQEAQHAVKSTTQARINN